MKKKRQDRPSLEELIPDKDRREEVLSRLYKGEPILGDGGIFTDMLQAFVNAALEGEVEHHLKEEKAAGRANRRNGNKRKFIRSTAGPMEIHTPRDRDGTHEPKLVKKWERELGTGLDDIILSLYARGQSVEDIRYQLRQIYGLGLSTGAISTVTEKVWTQIVEWQQRPLQSCYAVIYLDVIHYKIRFEGQVSTRAVYTVYGVDLEGQRDVLGLYLGEHEGANGWGLILEDLQRRGVEDVFFFCVDGLKGFKEAIEEVYPDSQVQRCIVHMVRTSVRFVSEKDRKAVCSDLRKVYTAANRKGAAAALEAFGQKWDKKYDEIRPKWEENWDELMAFMDYKGHIRRMIYTTNPVEALHRIMRKVTKSKGAWSNEKALLKQLYLALYHNEKSWKRRAFHWSAVQRELKKKFGGRFEKWLEP